MYSVSQGSLAARRRAKKEEQKDEAVSVASADPSDPSSAQPKTTPALLRIQKDLADLEIPDNVTLTKQDDMNFTFTIGASAGYWKGGVFDFTFSFPDKYPFTGPKVTCVDKIWWQHIHSRTHICTHYTQLYQLCSLSPIRSCCTVRCVVYPQAPQHRPRRRSVCQRAATVEADLLHADSAVRLLFLFTHPNPNDPLNQEAAKEMREQPAVFARNAVNALKGLRVNNIQFPKNRGKGF